MHLTFRAELKQVCDNIGYMRKIVWLVLAYKCKDFTLFFVFYHLK